ncbi:MAG TPA: SDR family NAD(P)-dependent oxidoreductase [Acidimicrobiales bacterium]|nr:SDR family NAD(P)-dependent oxidoreductase [Acidimicrobiales bacterium]
MESFAGRIAVVTGGGTGMGRELVRQLAAEGCHVAFCDVNEETMAETRALAEKEAPAGTRLVTFVADVSDEAQLQAFADHVRAELDTDHVHLVFNNAGIGGGGSFVVDDRASWERTFGICWGGVYNGCRAFLPLLVASDGGHLVNVSSVNGFWASIGPSVPHTAYSAAKFAVRGFTEALLTDLRINAPHVQAHVVMPGHVGTSIVLNSAAILGHTPESMTAEDLQRVRETAARLGMDASSVSDDDLRTFMTVRGEVFRDTAPTTAEQAATIILDGVREGRWRILVGDDAAVMDKGVRADPEGAYEPGFFEAITRDGGMDLGL